MNRTSLRRALVPTVAAIAMLSVTACGAANEDDDDKGGDSSGLSGTLNGGGASSQEAAQTAWRAGFQSLQGSGVTVNYDPTGSSGGREGFLDGGFAFAGTDSYLSDEEVAAAQETCGTGAIEVPAYVSPIAIMYNLEGVDSLKLSPQVIADIFNGKVTKWNDSAITELNDGVDLPDANINAVHRSDGSGTTGNFTNYLTNVVPENWPHGEVEDWPIKHGEGANGTSGVVAAVTDNPNSIGYADASQAGDLGHVEVQVGEGFVGPSAEAASKIVEVSTRVAGRAEADMAVDLDYQTTDDTAYPIVLVSYLVACQQYADQQTADLVKGYLSYVVGPEGQAAAADNAGSAPLSTTLADEALQHIEAISAK
ncbi:phosphate ABC transporter substrate-binding protein PstS [Nocardioides alcanivorans]|uniref:phosphate ABC transporter substrate-binding protein PstS n=1 Tax=Nocardioides alcanivorans TaxID=2897352 RepID=UPI001F369ECD|nr:phosphate ABC transporter substrate-binding protein PstS [Nocardioides alcanivorans]